jgi:hypothetical protein
MYTCYCSDHKCPNIYDARSTAETCMFPSIKARLARRQLMHSDRSSPLTHLISTTMNEILHKLRPQDAYRGEDGDGINSSDVAGWGSHAGHGNLSRSGGIQSVDVPRVHDVSSMQRVIMTWLTISHRRSSTLIPTLCLRTLRQRSSSHTEQRRLPLGSKVVSLSPLIRELPQEVTSVCYSVAI